MKITTIDKKALIALRPEIDAALEELGQRLGLSFRAGGGSFGTNEGHFKLEIKVDDPEVQRAANKAKWDANCRWIGVDFNRTDETGLRPEDFGTEFEMRGTRYETTHIAVGRSKYPVGVKVLTGPKAGSNLFFTEQVVPTIRAATDSKSA